MTAYPSADVSLFVVWIERGTSDDYAAAQRVSGIFNDPRVRQFHDPNRLAGDAFSTGLLEQPPAWDMYLLYAATPEHQWVDHPPHPADWMHQLGSVADPARERSGHDLVVSLYNAMSDLGFDPANESPPSEQTIAEAKRATNALVSSALREAASNDPSLAEVTQCDECAKMGPLSQCIPTGSGQSLFISSKQPPGSDTPGTGPISGEVIVLDIEGMRCPDCARNLSLSFMLFSGVKRAMVDFNASEAHVTIDPPNSVRPEMLIESIERSGFSASMDDQLPTQ